VREITRRETKTVPASIKTRDDAGLFAAVADVRLAPRGGADRVAKGAFDQTIKRWQESGERIPLYWQEIPSTRDLVGSVDPATLGDEDTFGPLLEGSIDLDGEQRAAARHAWTAVRSNAVELELEYMALAAQEADGIRTLQEVDLTAFTLKPTREGRQQVHQEDRLSLRELKRESQELKLEVALGFDRNRQRLSRDTAATEPDAGPPTETELRAKAAEYGVHIPPGRFDQIKTKARDDMVALLARADRGRT